MVAISEALRDHAKARLHIVHVCADNQAAIEAYFVHPAAGPQKKAMKATEQNPRDETNSELGQCGSKEEAKQSVQRWWEEEAPESYKWLGINDKLDSLGRKTTTQLVAYRSCHGDFGS